MKLDAIVDPVDILSDCFDRRRLLIKDALTFESFVISLEERQKRQAVGDNRRLSSCSC